MTDLPVSTIARRLPSTRDNNEGDHFTVRSIIVDVILVNCLYRLQNSLGGAPDREVSWQEGFTLYYRRTNDWTVTVRY